ELAHFDSLTRLPNRARFHEWLNEAVAAADHSARIARPLAAAAQGALLAIDIDRFKSVNDTLGHSAGDALLCEVADRLRAVCAELATGDLADGDVDVLPGRLGGDEFAVVLRGHDVAQAAVRLAGRLVDKLAEPYAIGRQAVHLGASIGLAVCPQDAASAEELMRHADIALYSAKADGKGVWRRFCQSMQSALQNRHDMERDLRRALENGEIGVHYQPQFSLAEQRVTGFEALMRWRHPERGLVPPASFIPVAEDLGLIVPLGEWILREACRQAARLPEDISMAVNISAVQLDHPGFVAAVVQALASAGLPARRLEIEVTESVLMEDKAQVQASIRRLRELGVRLALDDFGTGYASLSYLQRFPFDKIKIDRTFTRGLPDNPAASAIVAAVTALAGQLGMSTTAEGVEDEEQLAAITRLGC
ncbi:MAG TPA: EAL domain-containing protein, partial [Novosphingobium sp.]|nr:EAL domain-containing protein [Novosphingobium sp.]